VTAHAFGQGSSFAVDNVVVSNNEKVRMNVDQSVAIVHEQEKKPIEVCAVEALFAPTRDNVHPTFDHRINEQHQTPSPYAYVFYATQDTYACSVLVNIHQLQQIHKTPHRIFVLHTHGVSSSYITALSSTGATLALQTPPELKEGTTGGYYQDCLLKLLSFKMHHIDPTLKRVIVLDSDQLILKSLDHLFHMDELDVDLAAPRAYWIAKEVFSTAFMVITLSDRLWQKVQTALENIRFEQYDMDLANEVFGDEVLMLPGQFVALNSHWEDWNLPRWFHGTDAVGREENGTGVRELVRFDTKNLNKRQEEVRESGYEFKASDYEAESIVLEAKESSSTLVKSDKKPDAESPTAKHPHASNGKLPDIIPGITNPPKGSTGKPHLQDGVRVPSSSNTDSTTIESSTSDLKSRHLYNELFELYKQVSVLHYTALSKPWGLNAQIIDEGRADAHPLFKEQFMAWRKVAKDICPSDLVVDL
jgi:hypothetical protein